MSKFRFPAGLAVLLTFFATMTGGVWAQPVRGAIAGTVTDPSGAVIVGRRLPQPTLVPGRRVLWNLRLRARITSRPFRSARTP
jgi:hypothetical protein